MNGYAPAGTKRGTPFFRTPFGGKTITCKPLAVAFWNKRRICRAPL